MRAVPETAALTATEKSVSNRFCAAHATSLPRYFVLLPMISVQIHRIQKEIERFLIAFFGWSGQFLWRASEGSRRYNFETPQQHRFFFHSALAAFLRHRQAPIRLKAHHALLVKDHRAAKQPLLCQRESVFAVIAARPFICCVCLEGYMPPALYQILT